MILSGDTGAPFDDPDEVIRRALLDVSVPALLMSMVHMSGDASLIDGPFRPRAVRAKRSLLQTTIVLAVPESIDPPRGMGSAMSGCPSNRVRADDLLRHLGLSADFATQHISFLLRDD
jgi:hypothetical protein